MRINVTKSSMPAFEEYCEEIRELWDSHWLTNMGIKHKTLQANLEQYLNVSNVTLYTNGHLALEGALAALNLPKGGEIITTPFTFASTTHAIVRNGFTPVFCDINPDDFTMDVTKIEALITDKTVAIVPVHVYGHICDVDAIQAIADRHGLKVIYDAAHAFGEKKNGIGVANFGDMSMFSFHATKVYNTVEGGCVCYNNGDYQQVLDDWKNFGIHGQESVLYVGGNAKMSEFHAAMGICNLRHVDQWIAERKRAAEQYIERLKNVPGIRTFGCQEGVESNYAYFPIIIDETVFGADRDTVFAKLSEQDIIARKYFYPLTSSTEAFGGQFDVNQTPVALTASKRVLTLPLYSELSYEDVERICDALIACGVNK